MSVTPAAALERLRGLARSDALGTFCAEHGITLLAVFGSVVEVQRREGARDLDVAVLLDPTTSADVLTATNALVDLLGVDRVDVLDLARAGPVAQEQALVGTIPLYERDSGTLTTIRDRAMVLRMDTDWLRRLDLDLMESM